MPAAGKPLTAERFDGIDRRGGDFGLRPWQITAADDVVPIDDGHGLALRPPYLSGDPLSGASIRGADDIIGPFAVGPLLVGIYDAAFAAPDLPDGLSEVWPLRAPGYVPDDEDDLGWDYVGHTVLGSTLVVMLRWTDGSLHLHVWDGRPGYATEVTGTGCPWLELPAAVRSYTPRLGVAGSRVWISSPTGDLWFSAIGRPRVWWIKSADDIAVSGYEWVRTIEDDATEAVILAPYPVSELRNPDRYCGFVVEQMVVVAGVATWAETSYVLTLDAASAQGTTSPSSIPEWSEITVPDTEWITGGERTFRLRVVPPTVELGFRRRANRPDDLPSFATPRTESWVTTSGQLRLEVRDPSGFAWHNDGAVGPSLSPAPSGTATYEFTEVEISGRKVTCIKAIVLGTAYTAGTTVVWSYGMGDGFQVLVPTFRGTVAGKSVDVLGTSGANVAYVDGDVAGVFVNAKTKTLRFLTNFAKPDDLFLGRVTYDSTYPATSPAPVLADPGAGADAAWDEARFAESLTNAGDARAGILPTAQHAGGQQGVTMLVSARNRLLVCYADSIQLWEVDGAPADMRQLDKAPWGTGTQPAIRGANAGDFALIPSTRGIAAVSLSGQLNERLNASDAAGGIFGPDPGLLPAPTVHDMVAWPHMAAVVVALTVPGDDGPSLWAFIRDSGGKSLGWWRWNLPAGAVVRPGTLEAVGERLHWHGSGALRWAAARDAEAYGVGYTGTITWAYQHGGRPATWKRWMQADITCTGLVSLFARLLTSRTERALGVVTGNSYQYMPVPLMVAEPAISFRLTLEALDGAARIDRFEVQATPFAR